MGKGQITPESQGEKVETPKEISMSNSQWNSKINELNAQLAAANKKVDERDNVLKNISNNLIGLSMSCTETAATLQSMAKQIMQMVAPQQQQQNPNNKAN